MKNSIGKNLTNTTLGEQNETENTIEKKHMLVLPYQDKRETLLSNQWKRNLEICSLNI